MEKSIINTEIDNFYWNFLTANLTLYVENDSLNVLDQN